MSALTTGASRLLRTFAAAALAAVACAAAPAFAQEGSKLINTPAETFIVAPGGVDMRTGRYAYESTDLAIGGDGGSAGLALKRILTADVAGHANPFANLSHNWDIMVSEGRINIDNPQVGGQDFKVNVHFGGRSMTYQSRQSSYGYEQLSPTGYAPLTYSGGDRGSASVVYTYTAVDGTVAVFRPLGNNDCASRCAYVDSITETDGTVFTFSYAASGTASGGTARLARVTSSRGYALVLEGSGNHVTRACVLNLALAPASEVCPAGAPTATYTYVDTVGAKRLEAATGPDNATSSFTYAATATGGVAMGFVKPGQGSPWLTNNVRLRPDEQHVQQEIVDSQVFADGQSYTYTFTLSPDVSYKEQTIAGGRYFNALGHVTQVKFAWPVSPESNTPGSPCRSFPCAPVRREDRYDSWVYQQTPGPVSITAPLGLATQFDYCDPAAMAVINKCVVNPVAHAVTDPEGIRSELKHDNNFNVIEVRRRPKPGVLNPDGRVPDDIVTSAQYDTAPTSRSVNKPLSMTDARGHTTIWTYAPEHGGVRTETGPAVNGVTPQKRYFYVQRHARLSDGSLAGPAVWLLDRMSVCRTGNPSGDGCALGAGDEVVTVFDYGADGGPTNLQLRGQAAVADGTALRTCFAYDGLGRKISETSPNGTVGLSACPMSPPSSALPYTTSTRYDSGGQVTGTIAPDPDGAGPLPSPAVRNSYDAAGRLIRVEQGTLGAWQPDSVQPVHWPDFAVHKYVDTSFDALDRKTRELVVGGPWAEKAIEYGYDLAGRVKCTAVRMNPDVWATPLPDKCVPGPAHATYGSDRISKNVYDPAGRLTETWDGVGTPLQRREAHYTYNSNGQKTSLTDARGYLAEMKYDGFGRQSRWVFPSKTSPGAADPGDYEEYGYDADGNRTSSRKRDGSVLTFHYDALDRMTAKFVPERAGLSSVHTRDVYYEYDLRGLQTKARFDHPGGEGVTTAYDGFGRVTGSTLAMAGTSRTIGHVYDSDGNRVRITHPDAYFTYQYDGLGRFRRAYENGSDVVAGFDYDSAGRPASSGWSAPTAYGYDHAGRLSSLSHNPAGTSADQVIGLGYNPAGQIITRSGSNDAYAWTGSVAVSRDYSANGQNQYTGTVSNGSPSATFAYDANGNLVSDGTTTFTYDVENRLVSASGEKNAALVYDPLGRLFETSGGAAGITRFLYDDDALIGEYNADGFMLHRYVHGTGKGTDDPLVWYNNAVYGWRQVLMSDQQGSIIGVASMYGDPVAINTYDEYGIPGADNKGRFQYTGQAWIPELGMYHYKARIYSPTLGRFLQVDPIGYDDQVNLYGYVGNDPVNGTDPNGMQSEWSMDRRYIYPRLSESQREGLEEEHRKIGESATDGIVTGAASGLGGGLVLRGGAFLIARFASSSFTRAFSVAERLAGRLERTGGSSGQKTWQGSLSGGRAAAERLFNGFTRGKSAARDGGRLGSLRDGSTVQMSTRTLGNGIIRTDVRISREITTTGSRIRKTENIKLRFDESPR